MVVKIMLKKEHRPAILRAGHGAEMTGGSREFEEGHDLISSNSESFWGGKSMYIITIVRTNLLPEGCRLTLKIYPRSANNIKKENKSKL
jgi:hypothetical protein